MRTAEELNAIKEEVENVNKKLAELSEEELKQVTGGLLPVLDCPLKNIGDNGGCPYGGSMKSLMNCSGCQYAGY